MATMPASTATLCKFGVDGDRLDDVGGHQELQTEQDRTTELFTKHSVDWGLPQSRRGTTDLSASANPQYRVCHR